MQGILVASLYAAVIIPYRVAQRWALSSSCRSFPVGFLAALDGFVLVTPSTAVAAGNGSDFKAILAAIFENPSILFLFFLTAATFIAVHLCGLLLMRVGSATSYLVFTNIASFIIVAISWLMFKENITQSPLMIVGLLLSLGGGLWYAVEAQRRLNARAAAALPEGQEREPKAAPSGIPESLRADTHDRSGAGGLLAKAGS
eukprot:CAMPEP_0204589974 /NCGR_PEP_ID=MMETSP0661-20131031/49522_1 /ASSEMBLY_ACC=CAM_ASM_000606 /TAXON_ID=109239 /ORGANISM="Alexandrium margalefi, Strain AMGDE01CS-322" /LENGTH=200 /DNA_ID=CAMNT_0051599959 /DNA_START=14 /DNA_END=616 /DNA_ORIENTATION=-